MKAIKEKKDNITQDTTANINQIIMRITSAKIISIKETSQPKDCLI
jgi:hypothetical protein